MKVALIPQYIEAMQYIENKPDKQEYYAVAIKFYDDWRVDQTVAEMMYYDDTGHLPEWGIVIESVETINGNRLYIHNKL